MPAKSEKQRKAAGAELGRRKKGKKPRMFHGMSLKELRKMARKGKHTQSRPQHNPAQTFQVGPVVPAVNAVQAPIQPQQAFTQVPTGTQTQTATGGPDPFGTFTSQPAQSVPQPAVPQATIFMPPQQSGIPRPPRVARPPVRRRPGVRRRQGVLARRRRRFRRR